jgi:Zn-dependent metalloprotease
MERLLKDIHYPAVGRFGKSPKREEPQIRLNRSGFLTNFVSPPGAYIAVSGAPPDDPGQVGRRFLEQHARLLGAQPPDSGFQVIRKKEKAGRTHIRYRQTYSRLPVFGAEVILQINREAGVEYVLSDLMRDFPSRARIDVNPSPTLDSRETAVRTLATLSQENPGIEFRAEAPELMLFDPAVLGAAGEIRLVWKLNIAGVPVSTADSLILIDAYTGEIVRRYPLNLPELDREVCDSNNTTADPGSLERGEGDPVANIIDVDNAYDFLGDTYHFYSDHHQRDSIDDAGMTVSATLRYCDSENSCPWANAMWSSSQGRMYFGDGYAVDDIVAHEYTHGVTEYTSGLIYENHSGAINESFSDVWGEFVDLSNNAGNDSAAVRWEHGEDVETVRDMSDPPRFNQPDRLSSPLFVRSVQDPSRDNDFGGVHTNSGVNNKLCYLLTDGDSFNGQTIYGMGIARVADLYYEVNARLLSSAPDYYDLYHALAMAAVNLGWTAEERDNLYRACRAVEIGYDIYVDWSNSGFEDGSMPHPYNTVAEAYNAAEPGNRILIKGGNYNEAALYTKRLEMVARGGTVILGE